MKRREPVNQRSGHGLAKWRRAIIDALWIVHAGVGIAVGGIAVPAYAQECSPYSPDCISGGVSTPAGMCPTGQAPAGFCTVLICIEICSPVKTSPPPFTGGSGSTTGGGTTGSGGTGSGSGTGGSGSGGTGGTSSVPYNFFADSGQLSTDDINAMHWSRTTGATPDGRPMETVSNAPLDGGLGQFVDAEGKERFVTERQHYLNAIEGGLWTCNPQDDINTMTTSFVCEQISEGYEMPSGYTTVIGSDGLDGAYPDQPNKMTYRNWPEIQDGLTSGRIWDDPTNQTIFLAGMIATVPALYGLGALGDGGVEWLLTPAEVVDKTQVVSQQVLAAASIPGVTLPTLVQATTDAIAKVNNLAGPRLAQLTDMMEKVEDILKSEPPEMQVTMLKSMGMIPPDAIEKYAAESPDDFLRLMRTSIQFVREAPIHRILQTLVRVSDLQNEDLRATALRTLSEQAIGILPLENPTLAAVLTRGLPIQISESIGDLNELMVPVDNFVPMTIQFRPDVILPDVGPDGVTRMTVWINAVIEGFNGSGLPRMVFIQFGFPMKVVTPTLN